MSKILAEQLEAGFIFGDTEAEEYVYLPGGEIGAANPLCVIEKGKSRSDISMEEAIELILRLTLQPVRHPQLGLRSC
ncbi:hypothetical protein SDC9_77265 [bioreactor metagenome]|uniref:Uncharacterized protein n=1 Tax=bioreactor metagenome TaxID=1076179 RepID=A0A644YQ49_9ZZZZ